MRGRRLLPAFLYPFEYMPDYRPDGLFAADQPENQAHNKADEQAGCEGEEERNIFPPEIKITRKSADPVDFPRQQKQHPDTRQDQAKKDQGTTQI